MSASEETILLLRSIDASLKQLVLLNQLLSRTSIDPPRPLGTADDRDLDSKWGDPVIKFNPRDWTGDDCKGAHMSACPPEFLDMIAETFDYFAGKAEETNELYNGKPTAPYKRKDAARARGWAARIRTGYKTPTFADTEVSW
jgi:hypothetical protein